MKVIGVTGGIGSGKTTLCRMLEELGAAVFYADAEAKRLMEEDPAVREKLIEAFGSRAFESDGTLNRAYLADRVFGDDGARETINRIVHPAVRAEFARFVDGAEASGALVAVREAALLTGADEAFDELVVVEAPEARRARRVADRDGLSDDAIAARMEAQPDEGAFRAAADRVIKNDGSIDDLRSKASALWNEWTEADDD